MPVNDAGWPLWLPRMRIYSSLQGTTFSIADRLGGQRLDRGVLDEVKSSRTRSRVLLGERLKT